ncbi:exonuclease domain-containing protein [Pseudoclavibacter helvolus]|uniref:exonuclease domain-containing protein n=1 Tax=Pseudoclavibacter helvolus TaxID=255205 RepID=UPI0008397911|nr:exonuclease domain-containing protein [Pseudoclavibacter helvolus]
MNAQGFAVVDLETTGINPNGHDRIVEVGIVHVDPDGFVTRKWQSLVHPDRDLGPTHIHGITGSDMRGAPRFHEVADELSDLLDGRVVVAHNASFDTRFLGAEWNRAGCLPDRVFPSSYLCTMQMASTFLPGSGRKLADCCAAFDIEIEDAHSALGDAEATAKLLGGYLQMSSNQHLWRQAMGSPFTRSSVSRLGRRGMPVARTSLTGVGEDNLATALAAMPSAGGSDAERDYLALVDRCLEDSLLTVAEADELEHLATLLAIDTDRRRALHSEYFEQLVDVAWADGVLTEDELSRLIALGTILSLNSSQVDSARIPRNSLAPTVSISDGFAQEMTLQPGDRVVLTGEMTRPRSEFETMLAAFGCEVLAGLTKKTSVLVAADPDSLSGKAKKARQYGTPIRSEAWLTSQLATERPS